VRITLLGAWRYVVILGMLSVAARSSTVPIGTVNFDLTGLPSTATVDIVNETGPNSSTFPDTTFPVTTAVSLSSLGLTLDFAGGSSESFGSSYFALAPDGLSFNGAPISIVTPVTKAILTGAFSPTKWKLNDGSTFITTPTFTATITDTSGPLADGDFAIINGSTSGPPPTVPEPGTWALLASGLAVLVLCRRQHATAIKEWFSNPRIRRTWLGLLVVVLVLSSASGAIAVTSVKLNSWANPSSGIAGTSLVWVTASGFPSGAILPADVKLDLRTSCGTTSGETAATALKVTPIIGTGRKVQFQIPSSLATGDYFVSLSGTTTDGTAFASSDCSEVSVTHSSPAVESCNPGSSIGMLVPAATRGTTKVTAYVPNGNWSGGTTGILVVPVEGGGSPTSLATANLVNSCSTDSSLGISACTADGFPADVYLIKGTAITKTVTTAANRTAAFSGGSCYNCGVAVNAVTHQAVITMGFSGAESALQFLDLETGALGSPLPTAHEASEDVLWDPFLDLILSPDELSVYDLFKVSGTGLPRPSSVEEFAQLVSGGGGLDSAGEDCTTGIALSTSEGTGNLFIADLTQARFTPGMPGSWTAPGQLLFFPEFEGLSAGTSAIAVAPGSTHLGVVAGEFGGDAVGVIHLPSKSGKGTPNIVDYAYARLPNTPDGNVFSNGFDPHTTTAYTSPNNGKAYAVLASWATGSPSYLGIIDIQAMLSAPKTAGTHTVDPTYDLLAHGVVRYVATH